MYPHCHSSRSTERTSSDHCSCSFPTKITNDKERLIINRTPTNFKTLAGLEQNIFQKRTLADAVDGLPRKADVFEVVPLIVEQ
jgi:hypothetical protein